MFPPPQPWKEYRVPEVGRRYVALLSMFPMRSPRYLLGFSKRTSQVQKHLESTHGVMGAAFAADFLRLKMYTLSAWDDREKLQTFIHESPHAEAMDSEKPHLRRPAMFIYWDVDGRDLPLEWKDALRRAAVRERAAK